MTVLSLAATGFIPSLRNGRNRPLLLSCGDDAGAALEVVTKFRGREMDEKSQLVELVSAQLADDLGLDVPRAAVVDVPKDFHTIVPNAEDAEMVKVSARFNFGSVHLGTGFTTWPPGRVPHGAQRDQAAAIFAFDTLIQNPDRRAVNPNLWVRSDRLGVYDHEQAFSFLFLPMIGGAPRPWNPVDQTAGFPFLENHIFYASLRGSRFDLGPFEERLADLSDAKIDGYMTAVPEEWQRGHGLCGQIRAYLQEARQERNKLIGFVKHTAMKTPYSFVTLRYVHDVVTGEFVNVGVVLYAPEQRLLLARFSGSYERLNAIFLKIDHAHFRALVRYLTNRFEELGEDLRDALERRPMGEIEQLVRQVLPPDDSSLQWSEPGGGFTENAEETLRNLYSRLVERYVRDSELPSRTDDEIARPFKATLERKHVTQRIRQKRIEARDYQYEFQFGWQNSVWHLYEPVSFDLIDPGSIVEKATKWLGRGHALQDSPEKFKIHFLLGEPKQPGTAKAFAHALRLLRDIPGRPELVPENELTDFAEDVANKIARHAPAEAVVREEPPKE